MAFKKTRTGPLKWEFEFDGWHAVAFFGLFVLAGVAIGATL